jgi:3-mercaptopropionate dioxygenase
VYRGRQHETVYQRLDDGADERKAVLEVSRERTMGAGEFYPLFPPLDDIHYVKTVSAEPSVSIHLLANDTACVWRHRFEPSTGQVTAFRSGYSNAPCPPESALIARA